MASQIARRADAARNIERIVESAIHVFALDPGAGMAEVAIHAGVGRATLYRHFPTRDDLMLAIKARAVDETVAAVDSCSIDEGSALDCIERIVRSVIELKDRYRFISAQRVDASERSEARERIEAALRAAVERGQRRGEITKSVSADWAASAIRSVMLAAIGELDEGRLSEQDAARLATRTVLHGLAPARREKSR